MRRFRTYLIMLTAAISLAALCGACAWPRSGTLSSEQRQLASELDQLRGSNGLYTGGPPTQPGLYASAYGLAVLAAVGEPVRYDGSATALRAELDDQVRSDPLWGRWYLALLERALHQRLHEPSDVVAVERMRDGAGFFADPAAAPQLAVDNGYRLTTTAAALQTLAAFGVRLPDGERRSTAAWLDSTGVAAATSLTQWVHLVEALRALGLPYPNGWEGRLTAWWTRTLGVRAGVMTGDELLETCSYVQLATMMHVNLSGHLNTLRKALDPAVTAPSDPQAATMVVDAWSALHGDPARLAWLRETLNDQRLPSGLMPVDQTRLGDLLASYQVAMLRTQAGVPSEDPQLAAAIRAREAELPAGSDLGTRALLLAILASADASHFAVDPRTSSMLAAALPRVVTLDTVQQWYLETSALRALHIPVPEPIVRPWPYTTPEERYGTYLLAAGLPRYGREKGSISSGRLAADGIALLRGGSLHQAQAALSAAAAAGWRVTEGERTELAGLLRPLYGCPGTPALFRGSVTSSCDVYSTLSAWTIYRIIGRTPVPTAA